MMVEWTGMESVDRMLSLLEKRDAKRIGRSAMVAGLGELRKSIKRETPKGPTRTLYRSIGSRFAKSRKTKQMAAKVGVNVGKKRNSKSFAPHAAMVTIGTTQRKNKSGANRGSVDGNNFVERGVNFGLHKVLPAMIAKAKKQLEKLRAKR
jgi:hypothetical protein